MGGIASGLGDIGGGVASLFSGDSGGPPAPGAPGAPPSLDFTGPPAPGPTGAIGQELVGPPSPYPSPNFMQAFVEGFTGQTPGAGADTPLGAGPRVAGGVGELMRAIQGLKDPTSTANPLTGPVVNLVHSALRGPEQAGQPFGYKPAGTPSNIIQSLLASYTGGLLGSNKMGM